MKKKEPEPASMPIGEAILTLIVGGTLTYFFFEPGKEAISGFLKGLLQ